MQQRACRCGRRIPAGTQCPVCAPIRNKAANAAVKGVYNGTWKRLRLVVLAEQPLCTACFHEGKCTIATELDHIIPVAKRPDLRLEPSNLSPLCASCHSRKTASERHEPNRSGASRLPAAV